MVFNLLALFFLILPILLMIWMIQVQRRVRRRQYSDIDVRHREPWDEIVKVRDGLIYARHFDPCNDLNDAAGRVEDARHIRVLGVGL